MSPVSCMGLEAGELRLRPNGNPGGCAVWSALTARLARVPTSVKEMGDGTQGLASTGGECLHRGWEGDRQRAPRPTERQTGNLPVPRVPDVASPWPSGSPPVLAAGCPPSPSLGAVHHTCKFTRLLLPLACEFPEGVTCALSRGPVPYATPAVGGISKKEKKKKEFQLKK